MSPGLLRRLPALVAAASLLAGLAVAATARRVEAADALGTYSLTFDGVVAGRGGGIGASGGLVTFSGGPGDVVGRLDAAPSAAAQASSLEPGSTYRLVAGQANAQAGDQVLGEPTTARAEFPGDVTEDDATQAAPGPAGPVQVVGGEGHAVAAADRATAVGGVATFAVGADQDVPVLTVVGARATGRAVADAAAGTLRAHVEVAAERVEVLDQLVLHDVVGTATTTADGDDRDATATLVVGSATVGGVPVAITEDGVAATGEPLVPGGDLEDLTVQLNDALADAGIRVRLLGAHQQTEGTRASADSGGIGIDVTTPATQGVPRNDLSLVLGRGRTTLYAEPPRTAAAPTASSSLGTGADADAVAPTTRTGDVPARTTSRRVDVPAPTATGPTAPQVAPEAASAPDPAAGAPSAPAMVVAGARMSPRTAYAGFAAWLLFTSTIPLLGTVWLRRRGIA